MLATEPVCCFVNQAAHLWLHPQGFLQLRWLPAGGSSRAFRIALEQLLWHLHQQHWHKVFVDQRHMAALSATDTAWYLLDWLPRATQHHYRYAAVLRPCHVATRLSTHTIRQQAMDRFPLCYQLFEQEARAVAWLLAQP
ncbi:hypothetical protein [Hymenobacter sp. GOD-10R]|uniref:hypothetical protein n=1 Tax=Hymenobacter sp. GOD-10R TaxID=3093922 RepID=UPI002D7937B6|nr:hypothetical protein [Hymenobacter sp. GOD-10R]WRQ27678.1 hypothetical protein SD425_21640 [Hymenobacter sp. GOD-10R]